jgi:hypothetical protein
VNVWVNGRVARPMSDGRLARPEGVHTALNFTVRRQLVARREVQEHRDALLDSLCNQSTFGTYGLSDAPGSR